MANETFKDATGATKYRKATGAGTSGDPAVLHNIIDSGTITTVSTVTTLSQFGGQAITLGAGAVEAGTLRVTHASNDPVTTALQLIDDAVYVDDADWTDSTSKHVLVGGLYQSSPQTITDGDVGPLQVDENGFLKVNVAAGGAAGGTSAADDADFTDGTTPGTPAMGVYESTPTTVTDGDLGVVGITEERALKVHLVNGGSGGTAADDDADFTATSTQGTPIMGVYESSPSSVTDNDMGIVGITQTRALKVSAAASDAILTTIDGDTSNIVTAVQIIDNIVHVDDAPYTLGTHSGVMMMGFAGTQSVDANDAAALACTTAGALHVSDAGGSLTVDNGGTFAVQVDGAALTSLQLIDDAIYVDDADWTDDTSKHVLVGGVYQATPHTVTDGNVSPILLDENGRVVVTVNGTVTVGSHAVTNAGTFAVQVDGNALTSLQLIDDPVFADDAAYTIGTSKVMVAGGVVDDDSTDAADEGDAVAFRATKERKQRVVASLDSEYMQSGNDQVAPKFAVISAASSGDNTLVAAVASKKIRVLSYSLVANGTVTVRFESGAGGTALSGQMDFVANTGISVPFSPVGHFETAANTLLNLELSGAVEVAGHLTYIEVD